MSYRTLVELNHDRCPDMCSKSELLRWATSMAAYMRVGNPDQLPPGVTFKNMRHHSEPCPLEQTPQVKSRDSKKVSQ